MEQPRNNRFSTGVVTGLSVAFAIAVGAGGWWGWKQIERNADVPAVDSNTPSDSSPQVSERGTAKVYWLQPTEQSFELVALETSTEATQPPRVALQEAFEELLAGSDDPAYASAIPEGTKLLSLSVSGDNIQVNLSQEFTSGGGSASTIARLGQVIYTATSIDPEAKVSLQVQDQPIEYLGGEGVYVAQPMTRQEFDRNYDY